MKGFPLFLKWQDLLALEILHFSTTILQLWHKQTLEGHGWNYSSNMSGAHSHQRAGHIERLDE